jgi:hypothetical protein
MAPLGKPTHREWEEPDELPVQVPDPDEAPVREAPVPVGVPG